MAVVKWTALVTAMKGKLRGSVLQFGAGGQVLRSNRQYNQFSNERWNGSKNNLAAVTGNWRNLTSADRAAWAAQTLNYPTTDRYGNTHYPSPFTLHQRLNNAMLYHNGTLLTTPLAPQSFTNIAPISVTVGAGPTLTLDLNVHTAGNELVIISCTAPLSNGRRPPKGLYTLVARVNMSALTSYDFTTEYNNRFGAVLANAQIFVQVKLFNVDTGQLSPVLITSCNT